MADPGKVLLGVGAGIAAFKAAALASQLVQKGVTLRVAFSRDTAAFVGSRTFEGLAGSPVMTRSTQVDPDGSPPHIAATRDADCFVVAPATADLIARLRLGACDDGVTLCAVALPGSCPRVLCPAMNDSMWEDPSVRDNLDALRARGWQVLGPAEGWLAEGYHAVGRMVEPEAILAEVLRCLDGGRSS